MSDSSVEAGGSALPAASLEQLLQSTIAMQNDPNLSNSQQVVSSMNPQVSSNFSHLSPGLFYSNQLDLNQWFKSDLKSTRFLNFFDYFDLNQVIKILIKTYFWLMEIKIENYLLPDLSVARYFVATNMPFLQVEHPSFKQINAKLRPFMFLYMLQM